MRRLQFSIIEMMTVLVIILIIMSLMMPLLDDVKMNARTTICANQMRQLGVFITNYASDNNGYLPNDDYLDAPYKETLGGPQYVNGFYGHWQGHLSPYFETKLPQKYRRDVSGYVVGSEVIIKNVPTAASPYGKFQEGWIVLDDAINKGGHDSYTALICPEAYRTKDMIQYVNSGINVPRISLLMYSYGWTGIPTTYMANALYFGRNGWNNKLNQSWRLSDIPNLNETALLIEGGNTTSNMNNSQSPYYTLNLYLAYEGPDIKAIWNRLPRVGEPVGPGTRNWLGWHKMNFVHDKKREFWTLGGHNEKRDFYFDNTDPTYYSKILPFMQAFNDKFKGQAIMASGGVHDNGFSTYFGIVSFVDPQGGVIYQEFFQNNKNLIPNDWLSNIVKNGNWVHFNAEEAIDYHYLVGDMNVLTGDGSVTKKDNAWLFNNRIRFGAIKP